MNSKFLGILSLTFWLGCQEKAILIKPDLRSLTESVYATATIQPSDVYQV